jgi:superfamily I DNA/RNA helicase
VRVPRVTVPRASIPRVGLANDSEARLVRELTRLAESLVSSPTLASPGEVVDALGNVGRVIMPIGPPGTGKTTASTSLITSGSLPTPGLAVAFTNADAAELNHRVRRAGASGFEVMTLHAYAVRTLGRMFMVGYGIKVPGSRKRFKTRDGRVIERVFIDLAQELLRARAARAFGLPYSMDPFEEGVGNLAFRVFDIYVHTRGLSDLDGLYRMLGSVDARLAGAVKSYVDYLSRFSAFDFTTVLWDLYLRSRVGVDYRSLVIDEWQDWSPLMNAILVNWASRGLDVVVLAGDVDQLVYHSLNGANEGAFLAVYRALRAGKLRGEVVFLSQSHRVLEPLNRMAVGVLRRFTPRQEWDGWRGRSEGSIPVLHVKPWPLVLNELVELYNNNRLRKYFVLAPVNAAVIHAARSLIAYDIVPLFLKSVPSVVVHYASIARRVLKTYIEERGSLPTSPVDINTYLPSDLRPESARLVWHIAEFAINTAERERGSNESIIDALERVLDTYINPRRMTYEHITNGYIYTDTIYTAKGLEANHVIILDWDVKRREVDGYMARLWYVALTRSRGSVTIVPPPGSGFVTAMPISVLAEEARRAGVEVVGYGKA